MYLHLPVKDCAVDLQLKSAFRLRLIVKVITGAIVFNLVFKNLAHKLTNLLLNIVFLSKQTQ
jgi:hypothetical protein